MRVEIDNVHKSYASVTALDGISFDIPAGSVFGVLGTNGAGKTTLFELLVGHDTPDAGHLTVGEIDVVHAGESVRKHIGFLPEQVGFPDLLTGREVLRIQGRIRGIGPTLETKIEEVLEIVDLEDAADRPVSGYSNGMQTRIGLAAALLDDPAVLILDEPTAGLDPRGVEAFHRLIERINREQGTTVVLSSHSLGDVERLCDTVAILHDGQLCDVHEVGSMDTPSEATTKVTILTTRDDHQASIVKVADSVGSVTVEGDQVVVTLPTEGVVDLIASMESDWIAGLEVHEPGLASAFHEAIDNADDAIDSEVMIG